MAYLLAWDTSTLQALVSLSQLTQGDAHLVDSVQMSAEAKHSENLLFTLDRMLSKNNLTMESISALGLGVGPGSFTGLRIGIATARGLLMAHPHLKCVSTSSLALLENQGLSIVQPEIKATDRILSLTHSTKTELYFRESELDPSSRHPRALSEWTGTLSETFDILRSNPKQDYILIEDSPIFWNESDLQTKKELETNGNLKRQITTKSTPEALHLVCSDLLIQGQLTKVENLVPNYARLSAPEKRLQELQRKDPDHSWKTLK